MTSTQVLALLADVTAKGSLVLVMSLALVQSLRGTSAAQRHLILLLAILSFVALPVLSLSLPQLAIIPTMPWANELRSVHSTGYLSTTIGGAVTTQSHASQTIQIVDLPGLSHRHSDEAIPMGLITVWLAGVALVGLRTRIGTWQRGRIASSAAPAQDEVWLEEVRIPRWLRVEVKFSHAQVMPMAWGVLRGQVLLPDTAAKWSAARRRAVLAHEIAHLLRLDTLSQAFVRLICTLFWFNPLLWLAVKRLCAEQEMACDDLAMGEVKEATEYASHILAVVAGIAKSRSTRYVSSALADRTCLEYRIRSILDPSLCRARVAPSFLILSICLAIAAVVPLAALAPRAGAYDPANQPRLRSRPTSLKFAVTDRAYSLPHECWGMGRTPLHRAAARGNTHILSRLLADGVAPETRDEEGRSPLHLAARGGHAEAVELLVGAGCDLAARDMEGRTPLHLAARNGHPRVVEQLLIGGENADTIDFEGRTPLESAAAAGNDQIVTLLRKSGASIVAE